MPCLACMAPHSCDARPDRVVHAQWDRVSERPAGGACTHDDASSRRCLRHRVSHRPSQCHVRGSHGERHAASRCGSRAPSQRRCVLQQLETRCCGGLRAWGCRRGCILLVVPTVRVCDAQLSERTERKPCCARWCSTASQRVRSRSTALRRCGGWRRTSMFTLWTPTMVTLAVVLMQCMLSVRVSVCVAVTVRDLVQRSFGARSSSSARTLRAVRCSPPD
jgi:hypothetical protein